MALITLKDLILCNISAGIWVGRGRLPFCLYFPREISKSQKQKTSQVSRVSASRSQEATPCFEPVLLVLLTVRPESQVVSLWYHIFMQCGNISRELWSSRHSAGWLSSTLVGFQSVGHPHP